MASPLFYVAAHARKPVSNEVFMKHDNITDIPTYLRQFSSELGERILESFPPLHDAQDPPSLLLKKLLRRPYPAQAIAVGGVVKRLAEARSAAAVAESTSAALSPMAAGSFSGPRRIGGGTAASTSASSDGWPRSVSIAAVSAVLSPR